MHSIKAKLLLQSVPALAMALVVEPGQAQSIAPVSNAQTAAVAGTIDTGDIIVTAQKRSQRLLDVPLSVQVQSAVTLDRANVKDLGDLAIVTPGITVSRVIANTAPYIRGIGTTSPLTGVESAVAINIDGVYQPASVGNIFALNNISAIEILKGPQGTLYGRNATGGVINVKTLDPSQNFGARLKLGYQNYNTWTGNGYVTGALSDRLSADLAVYYTKQSKGFGRDLTLDTPFLTEEEYSARAKLLFQITDNTALKLSGDYTHIRSDKGVGAVPIRDGSDGAYTNVGYFDTLAGFPYAAHVKSTGGSGQFDHGFDFATLKIITAYRTVDSYQQFSQLGDAARPNAVEARTNNLEKTFSDEIQLTSKGRGPFSWIAGFFYMHDDAIYKSPNGFTVDAATPFGQVRVANVGSTQKLNSLSGYVDASLKLGTGTTLTGGLRYTHDARDFTGLRNPTQAVQVIGGVPTIVSVPPAVILVDNETEAKLTYRVVIQQQLAPDVMIYGSRSTGFKSGGFASNAPLNPALRPENVTAHEVGAKGRFFDGVLTATAAAFFYNYTDLQVTRVVGASPIPENAGKARIKGVEFQTNFDVTRHLQLTAGGQYLDARYTDYSAVPTVVPLPNSTANQNGPIIDASGKHLRLAPKYMLTLGFSYVAPIGTSELRINGNYLYNDGYFFYADERVRQNSFNIFNANVGMFFDHGRYGISVFGKNLSNAHYYVSCRCGDTAGDFASPAEPRRYGVSLEAKL